MSRKRSGVMRAGLAAAKEAAAEWAAYVEGVGEMLEGERRKKVALHAAAPASDAIN